MRSTSPSRSRAGSRSAVAGFAAFAVVLALGVPAATAAPDAGLAALVSIAAPVEVERGRDAIFGVTVRALKSGTPLGEVRVVLQRRSGDRWVQADEALTESGGRAVLTATVLPPDQEFRAKLPRTGAYAAAHSAEVTVVVN